MKKIFIFVCLIFGAILTIYGVNFFTLQKQMDTVLTENNKDEKVNVYYDYYINPKILVYDLNSVSESDSKATVFATFLKFADNIQTRNFDVVKLCFRGQEKFQLKGAYFKKLGEEYSFQNPIYTINHFSENLFKPDGTEAYSTWTGGMIMVMMQQMTDFNDFHDKWYMNDLTKTN